MGGSNVPQAFPNYLICLHFIRISTVIISGHVIQFQYSVAYSAPVECKTWNNTGIIGSFERIIGSCWGNKRIE